jgi:excisionase family DNA binding protein
MSTLTTRKNTPRVGWRVNDWADSVGLGRAYTYEMINEGRIKSVKVGGARIITTPPDEFLRNAEKDEV